MNPDLKPGPTPEVTNINIVQHVHLYVQPSYLAITVLSLAPFLKELQQYLKTHTQKNNIFVYI